MLSSMFDTMAMQTNIKFTTSYFVLKKYNILRTNERNSDRK